MLDITKKTTQSPRHLEPMLNAAQLRFRLGPPMTNRWESMDVGSGQWVGESISGIDRFTYKVVPGHDSVQLVRL